MPIVEVVLLDERQVALLGPQNSERLADRLGELVGDELAELLDGLTGLVEPDGPTERRRRLRVVDDSLTEVEHMSLVAKQHGFAVMIARLILYANDKGYQLSFGEAYRPPETAELYAKQGRGIKNSLHCQRLAVDFNLFVEGDLQTAVTPGFIDLHDYWSSIGGAPMIRKDANHFSVVHEGRW